MPKGVWMHDWKTPVAKTLEAKELLPGDPLLPPVLKDNGGAYVKAQFNLGTGPLGSRVVSMHNRLVVVM
jgi:hypothetical protein